MAFSDRTSNWPVARTYRGAERVHVSLPLGGIGTGTVGFGGRGQFRDWELENHPAKGHTAPLSFFACRTSAPGLPTQARILEGALFDGEVEGWQGATAPLAGVPRFSECEFETTYPMGRARLADPAMPVEVEVEAFNPLCPAGEAESSKPLAIFRVRVRSVHSEPVDVNLMFSVEALVGHRLRAAGLPSQPLVEPQAGPGAHGVLLSDQAMDPAAEDWGTLAAAVVADQAWVGPAWGFGKWNQGLFAMWRGYIETGRPGPGIYGLGSHGPTSEASMAGTLGADLTVAPHGTGEAVFVLGWNFPNRRAWLFDRGPRGKAGTETVGNFYAGAGQNAWDIVSGHLSQLDELREVTERFVSAFWSSDLSPAVKEAALFNVSTLRSQTYFRTADGWPFGWEGCIDDVGSCLGSCTHVWNYDLATGYLFAGLARQMRELEYLYGTDTDGGMSFRLMLPLDRARELPVTAADGQFGCVLKLYREWRLSGDDEWLAKLWPSCRRSIEFAWIPGGWDADRDGLAEGAQHNTMDVEYFGPSPVIQSWYLAALRAGEEMASAVGDREFAEICRQVYASGAAATEAQLFNGQYYEQKIVPPGDFANVAPRLRHGSMGAEQADDPEFQIGDGCLIDQAVGDTYARLVGLGPVFDLGHVKEALDSVHRLNYVEDLGEWTNYMRTYAVDGERGHIVLSYPKGLPKHPMPYWCEVWTGLEYVFALGLVQQDESAVAEEIVAAVRERFSGVRRNPYDEAECGHHYARAMASWGLIVGLTGFDYDGRHGVIKFAEAKGPSRWFWSTGQAWGTLRQSGASPATSSAQLEVAYGSVRVERAIIGGSVLRPQTPGLLVAGATYDLAGEA
jgi:uncharacterized protein (DUF608 family)